MFPTCRLENGIYNLSIITIMAVSRNYSGSRKLILFAYINVIICGIFHPKTSISKNVPSWQRFFVCTEVIRVKRLNCVDKRGRENLRMRCIFHHIKHHLFNKLTQFNTVLFHESHAQHN